jgi:hypothetical protein
MQTSDSAQFKPRDDPVWIRREKDQKMREEKGSDLSFGLYLLLSTMVAIAAVCSPWT